MDLSHNTLCGINKYGSGTYTSEGIKDIADALRVSASLTVADLRHNKMDNDESVRTLVKVAKDKKISLCGITPDQTRADFTVLAQERYQRMGAADAMLLTADLAVRASLTQVPAFFATRAAACTRCCMLHTTTEITFLIFTDGSI